MNHKWEEKELTLRVISEMLIEVGWIMCDTGHNRYFVINPVNVPANLCFNFGEKEAVIEINFCDEKIDDMISHFGTTRIPIGDCIAEVEYDNDDYAIALRIINKNVVTSFYNFSRIKSKVWKGEGK